MKFNFNKISAVVVSGLVAVSGVGFAAAMFPSPFIDDGNHDFAVVYGTGVGALDHTPAVSIGEYFKVLYDTEHSNETEVITNFETSDGVTEKEIVLGDSIVDGNIKSILTDNKIPNLFDGKIHWDDGVSNDDNFNVHEEIVITNDKLNIITTLNDKELTETALTNDKGLEYKYVFEETINTSRLDHEDADDFVINLLGEDVTITEMEDNEVTFTKGDRHLLDKGDTLTIDGKTIILESVYEDKVFVSVDGDVRRIREGETARIQGIEVRLSEVLYQGYAGGVERAELFISEDVEISVSDGDAYFGEDEDDPKWVWSIDNAGEEDGHIGVRYNEREMDTDDDLVYVGDSYVFPRNFAQVSFLGTTDVDYEDFELSFDDSMDLYHETEKSVVVRENVPVVMIKGETDESLLVSDKETDSIYLYYNNTDNIVEVYYKDVNKDISDSAKVRFVNEYDVNQPVYNESNSSQIIGYEISLSQDIVTLVSDDTEFTVNLNIEGDNVILSMGDIKISVGGDNAFEYLGSKEEDAESDDVMVGDKNIGTREDDVMDYYGTIIRSPEGNTDADEVILSVPSERVYAQVAVLGSEGSVNTNTISNKLQTGSLIVKDTEITSVSNKNQIIVGGSCINAEAARLLGVPLGTCGEAFTKATGVGPGEYFAKTYTSTTNPEKVVVLVAGYHAADTVRGVNDLLVSNVNI